MHQQVTQFPNTYIHFPLSLLKKKLDQFNTHIIRFCSLNTIYNMQYAESLHEIVIKRIHYDSRTTYDFTKMCTSCTCHTDYRLSYNSDHFNTNFSYFFSDTYIVFKASILIFKMCINSKKNTLLSLFFIR